MRHFGVDTVEIEQIVRMNPPLRHLEGIQTGSTPTLEAEANTHLRSSDMVVDNIAGRNSQVVLEEKKLYWAEILFADKLSPLVTADLALTDCSLSDVGSRNIVDM